MSLLHAENISIDFGGIHALVGVGFDVREGEIFTIIGPNGAGKSTLFNIINRFYPPSSGALAFKGDNLLHVPAHRIAALGIARTFQNIELFQGASVVDNMLLGRHVRRQTGILHSLFYTERLRDEEHRHREAVEEVIDFLDLEAYREQIIANLPYGVRKVVELGRALASRPKLLLLDEPSSGLNVEESQDMSFWIRDIRDLLGITIVMVEHDMTLVNAVSDRVLALNEGRVIAEGLPREVQTHKEVARAYLGDTT